MKIVIVVACLLAVANSVHGADDQDAIVAKYMEYLMPDIKPCADEFHYNAQVTNIQTVAASMDLSQMGCFKACVMKRMSILTGLDFHLEPIYKMIDTVHAGNDAEIASTREIADACYKELEGVTDECNIGNIYTDCYIAKLLP